MESLMGEKLYYRESIKGLLASIAELDLNVGPFELCCMWFDDLYFPGQKDTHIYKPEVWQLGLSEWRACFSEKELHALARFHQIFEHLNNHLSMEQPDQWVQDPNWQKVSEAAKIALTEFEEK